MKIDLSNQIAVVTGATGDLGRVITRTLAECGADIVVHYHTNRAKAEELVHEVGKMGRRAVPIQASVTDYDAVCAMQKQVSAELGDASIIVNNAVIQYQWTQILEQDPADYEHQFQSCAMHNLYMAKAFVPAMIQKRWGRVIGINTECSLQCWPSQSAYVSGKHGMNALLQCLAKEVGVHGVTVNQVAPGWMFSDRDRGRSDTPLELQQVIDSYSAMLPLKHRGEDQDIANTVAFFASDLAKFITGAFLPVNGGGAVLPPWL